MYLYVRKYESASRWDEKKPFKGFYPQELEKLGNKIAERNFMSKETDYQVGYWRKANAIHNWFVQNCANGEDNCEPVYVSKKDLEKLLKEVNEVLENKGKANDILPTQRGFFFGSYEYDEWYFKDLTYTKELLEDVLEFLEGKDYHYSIVYQASW